MSKLLFELSTALGLYMGDWSVGKEHFKIVFKNLHIKICCDRCREIYSEYLKDHPVDTLDDRRDLLNWLVDLDKCYNRDRHKKLTDETFYDSVKKAYEQYRSLHKTVESTPTYEDVSRTDVSSVQQLGE